MLRDDIHGPYELWLSTNDAYGVFIVVIQMTNDITIDIDNQQRSIYKYINSKLGSKLDIGILENDNGQYVTCDADKTELLNSYFSSVSVQDNSRNPAFEHRVADVVKK